ncbi:Host cell factor 2 [Irineochytrium annulatum]|nr:Host cell factor 2 [Irineochytrium annulatum]
MTTGSPSRRNSRALQEHQPKGAVDQLAAEVNQKAALKNGSSENNTVVPHIHSEGPSAIWTSLSVTDETPDFACHGYKCALVLSREQERRKVDEDDRKEFTSVRNGIARPEDLVVDEANGKLATEMLMLWGSDGETIRNEVHSLDFGSRRWTRRHPLVASDPNYAKFPTKSASNGRSRNHDAISKKAKAAFGCCSHGSKVYIFGGLPSNPARKSQASDEILEYDAFTDTITVLTPINPEETNKDGTRLAPRPAIGSTLTYVPPLANSDEHPCLYLYGGLVDGRDYNELHVFDLKTRRWSLPVHDSSQRAYRLESHSALYHPGNSKGAGRKIIVFGGMHETLRTSDNKLRVERSNDVFYLNIKPNGHVTWFKVEPEGEKPPGRSMHSAVLWGAPQGPHMVIFGGWVETYAPHPKLYEPEEAENVGIDHDSLLQSSRWRCTNDLWVYDIARGFWKRCLYEAGARSPSPRSGHSAVMYLNQMYIFGGRSGYNNSGLHVMGVEGSKLNFANDAWVCDLGTPPPPGELKTDSVGSDRISLSWVDPFRFHSDRKIRISIRELKAAGKNDAHKTVEGDWHHICEDFAMKGRLEVRSSDAFKLEPGRWYTLALVAVNAFGETPSLALQSLMQTQNPSPEMMMHRQSLTKMGKPLTEVKMLNEVGRAKKPVLASVVPQHEGSAIKSFKLVWKFGKDVALSGGVFRDYCIECCAMLDLHPSDLDRIVAVNGVAAKDSFKVYSKLGSERDSSGNGVSQLGAPWVEIWRGQESFAEITATQLLQNSAVVLAYERLMENRRKALDTLSRRERDGGRGLRR